MPIKIDIPGGGTDTSDATAGANDILSGKTAYVNDKKITGTISSHPAQIYTPGTYNQTISSGKYLSGTQTIKGDTNLKSSNIKSGVSIFGVEGSAQTLQSYELTIQKNASLTCRTIDGITTNTSAGPFLEWMISTFDTNPRDPLVSIETSYGIVPVSYVQISGRIVIMKINETPYPVIAGYVYYGYQSKDVNTEFLIWNMLSFSNSDYTRDQLVVRVLYDGSNNRSTVIYGFYYDATVGLTGTAKRSLSLGFLYV